MNPNRSAVFLIHLVQDVNVLRPLVFMAAREFRFDTLLLVSTKFTARDVLGIWRNELAQICSQSGARMEFFDDDWEAHQLLTGQGLLFSASESHLPNHATTHDVFRHAPPGYLRVTLQHGFECVGFRHSADHIRAHGETASFAADIVCAWSEGAGLPSVTSSQLSKLWVTGPTAVLQMPDGPVNRDARAPGIVCENLHSVRFKTSDASRAEFVATFTEFSRRMAKRKREIRLRAHPGGQYVLRNRIALPANVKIENAPIYRLDLRRFSYAISAPSSVLIDMLLAGVPTGVWCPHDGHMDASNYDGLAIVSTARDWERFARAAETEPERFLSGQQQFLKRTGLVLDPREVFSRFASLFQAAQRMEVRPPGSVAERERILFIANAEDDATIVSAFAMPLASLVARGEIATRAWSERQLLVGSVSQGEDDHRAKLIEEGLNSFNPSIIVFCGYSGGGYLPVVDWAHRQRTPTIYYAPGESQDDKRETIGGQFSANLAPEHAPDIGKLLGSVDLLCGSNIEGLISDLDLSLNNVNERSATEPRTQKKTEPKHEIACLREEVLDLFARAHAGVRRRSGNHQKKEERVCRVP